jgi:hypothetical protein
VNLLETNVEQKSEQEVETKPAAIAVQELAPAKLQAAQKVSGSES